MPEKEKKKSWREIQRERQKRQQRAEEAFKIQMERETKRKPRKWPKGKILLAAIALIVILGIYGLWQLTATPTTPTDGTTPVTPVSGYIVIMPDGAVNPSNAPIANDGNNRYTFTADIYNQIIVGKDNIIIDGNGYTLNGTGEYLARGIDLTGRKNVTITNIKIQNFDYGIYLSSACNNTIYKNTFTNNHCGIWLEATSNGNIIYGNNLTKNKMYAIWLKESIENTISENTFTLHTNYTIYMRYANKTTITKNYIKNNNMGIFLYQSTNNILYHNSFIDNMPTGHVSADLPNKWDNGKEGNYWSDYNGIDANGDGIGDTPYIIDQQNQDRYPLMRGVATPPTPTAGIPIETEIVAAAIVVIAVTAVLVYRRRKA
ncbi:MAG: right-handed parallel beta-helix repeat-containing protein [Candidatus Bathyarchaeota archaeon]|nr:right-handed parallel beta-helix repeat-containing protein [Candidatus Bathyarchaeota archaeon]